MKDKNKNSSGGIKISLLILAVLIIIFGVLLTYIRYRDMNSDAAQKNSEDQIAAENEELYDRIMTMDESTYPRKPDDVMQLYGKFYLLMYSNYLDDERLREFVLKGRIFFGSNLIELNSEDSQLIVFEHEVNDMNDLGVTISDIIIGPCVASSEDKGVYISYVTRKLSNGLTTSWNYYLEESASGLYKIRAWERAEQK